MPLSDTKKVAAIIADAGGRVVGRTRLQKVAYLLTVTGFENAFDFKYKHFGPYSDELAAAAHLGRLLGDLVETEQSASWGGTYSIFTSAKQNSDVGDEARCRFARTASDSDAVELELAATAVFLAIEGFPDPWGETERRKPEKSDGGRLEKSKALLRSLSTLHAPIQLPAIF